MAFEINIELHVLDQKTLTPYASAIKTNPLKLCTTALAAAVQATKNCSAAVSEALEPEGASSAGGAGDQGVIGDLKDAVGDLKQTAAAMGHLRGGDRKFHWVNAKTYGSAAITDADTCLDEVLERKVNPVVKKKIRAVLVGLRN
ncbi:21 kDa protein [Phtheirospermum japonicum]|uniref:21 kDa protein n=1 Tax=Phtheirospermum japonicum TaxID=374723 RepID=A0A830DFQ3_9LAMI|nr:21 kDa protein [Phtheirospermum japonicum]